MGKSEKPTVDEIYTVANSGNIRRKPRKYFS